MVVSGYALRANPTYRLARADERVARHPTVMRGQTRNAANARRCAHVTG